MCKFVKLSPSPPYSTAGAAKMKRLGAVAAKMKRLGAGAAKMKRLGAGTAENGSVTLICIITMKSFFLKICLPKVKDLH